MDRVCVELYLTGDSLTIYIMLKIVSHIGDAMISQDKVKVGTVDFKLGYMKITLGNRPINFL